MQNVIGRSIINMKYNETIIKESHIPKLSYSDSLQLNKINKNSVIKYENKQVKSLKEIMEQLEKEVILDSLNRNNGNRTATAPIILP